MPLFGLPDGIDYTGGIAPPQSAPEPFMWGSGGRRMTPEQIARERDVAQALIQEGTSYAPVQHWTQGLARVSQALLGSLDARRADEAEARNMDAQSQIAAALAGGNGAPGDYNALLLDPYVDPATKQATIGMLRARPKPAGPTDMMQNYDWLRSFNPQAAENFLTTKTSAPPIVAHNADGTMTVYPAGSIPQASSPQPQPSGPAPGTIEEGYQFMGGDPADKNNWQAVGGPTQPASGAFR